MIRKRSALRSLGGSRSARVVGICAAVLIAAVAAAGLFYLFGRSAPAAVGLGNGTSASDTVAVASPNASGGLAASAGTDSDLSGTWTVDTSIGSFADYTGSFVGYRVQEELANVGAATAVGRTPDVTGSLVLEGSTVTSVEIEADLTTLQSDNDMRDGQLARQGLGLAHTLWLHSC